jgi:hypothetical protein
VAILYIKNFAIFVNFPHLPTQPKQLGTWRFVSAMVGAIDGNCGIAKSCAAAVFPSVFGTIERGR